MVTRPELGRSRRKGESSRAVLAPPLAKFLRPWQSQISREAAGGRRSRFPRQSDAMGVPRICPDGNATLLSGDWRFREGI